MNINFIDFLKENDKIEIPIIQRGYAQGREDAKTESIRKTFAAELVKAIDDKKTLHLDFIYGSTAQIDYKRVFYPLDGQQRLTTLFLLHWYLYARTTTKKSDKKEILLKFSYETRTSSRDFTKKLVNKKIIINNNLKISEQITNQNWFFLAWKKDPTIKGMLNMLDEIHRVYFQKKYKDKIDNHFTSLFEENSPISFDYLNMGEFSLSDDLYVKMNARGKQLTEFENFKAWLGKHIEDEEFMRFFRNMAQVLYARDFLDSSKDETFIKNANLLAYEKSNETNEYVYIPNAFYKKLKILNKKNNITEKTNLATIFSILDHLHNFDKRYNLRSCLDNIFPNKVFLSQRSVFEIFIKGNMTYRDKVLFYSFTIYLLKFKNDINGLKYWMRIMRNLIYNTEIALRDLADAIKSVDFLLNNLNEETNINKYLISNGSQIAFFNREQVNEEILKAKLIQENNNWKKELLIAENHALFSGQISFLLKKTDEDYSELFEIDNNDLKFFINNRSLAQKMWNKERANNFNNKQLLIRALLSMNFPIQRETDLSNNKESWKKLFRDIDYQKSILKLFSKINNNLIEESLKNIIEKYPDYTNSENDCRSFLIKDDNLLKNKPYIWYWCKDKAELRSFRTARADYNRTFIFPSRSEIFNKIAKEMNVEVQENKERLFVEIENKICIEQYFWWEDIRYGFRIKINSPEKNKNEYWKGGFKEIEITNSGVTLFCKNIRAMLAQNKFI